MLNFVEHTADFGTAGSPQRKAYGKGQTSADKRKELISRVETAREALFATTKRDPHLSDVRYAAIGVSLHVQAGNTSSVKVCPFSNSSGWILPGLLLTAGSEGIASYLLADVISFLEAGLLDDFLGAKHSIHGHIDSLKGYPEILAWEDEKGNDVCLNRPCALTCEEGF